MGRYKVAYYAHHFGTGHLRHAQRLADLGRVDLQVASTGERRHDLLPGALQYVPLPADAGAYQPPGKMRLGDYLHYAPVGPGIQQRFAALSRAWEHFVPDVVMVDVSVEVALFARLSGYPVAFRRMPGDRWDRAHQLAYSLCDGLFGYFPASLEDPAHLQVYGAKSHYLGVPEPTRLRVPAGYPAMTPRRPRRVLVQTSLASAIPLRQLASAARASGAWQWEVAGAVHDDGTPLPENLTLHGVVPDPGELLREADVVISSAGHNAVAAAAASHRPVLLVPEERPHGEQLNFARALQSTAGIPMHESWAMPAPWPALLERVSFTARGALGQALFVTESSFTTELDSLLAACIETARA